MSTWKSLTNQFTSPIRPAAASCGLQYLCEASFNADEAMFSDELREHLQRAAPSRIEYEQQVDFLCNGTFRKSLLCQAEVSIATQPSLLAVKIFIFVQPPN